MGVLLLQDIKLIMVFLLIGSVIGLSHLSEKLTKSKRGRDGRRWRAIGPSAKSAAAAH